MHSFSQRGLSEELQSLMEHQRSELTNVNNWIGKHGFPLQTPKCDQKQYCRKNFHLSCQNLSSIGSERCRSDGSFKSCAERQLVLLSNCQPMLFFMLKANSSVTRFGEHPSKHPDVQDLQANPSKVKMCFINCWGFYSPV